MCPVYRSQIDLQEVIVHVVLLLIWVLHEFTRFIRQFHPLNCDHVSHVYAHLVWLQLREFVVFVALDGFEEDARPANLEFSFDFPLLSAIVNIDRRFDFFISHHE